MVNGRDPWDDLLDDIDSPETEEFVDDWYCHNCEFGPIGEEKDACPRCDTKWNEQSPGGEDCDEDGYPIEKYEEVY